MKPSRTLARTLTPDGAQLTLQEHDGEYYLRLNGKALMSTTATTSELMLAKVACGALSRIAEPVVLIGGLGLGFTLKGVMEMVGKKAAVHVAELIPELVEWNRKFLLGVNGRLLNDRRVRVETADVFEIIKRAPRAAYDAILLDLDNGPTGFVQGQNSRVYDRGGFRLIERSLRPDGKAAFWSACEDEPFYRRLCASGYTVEVIEAKAYEQAKRAAHRIYLVERMI